MMDSTNCFMVIVILCCLLNIYSVAETGTSKGVAEGPLNTAGVADGSVLLQCEATDGTTRINWFEYATGNPYGRQISDGQYVAPGHPNSERYEIIHDDATSYDLLISDTVFEDGGLYRCLDAANPIEETAYAELVMLRSDPVCVSTYAAYGEVIDGHTYSIQCSVDYRGEVGPIMTWSGPQPFTVESSKTNETVSSKLTFTATMSLNGSHFTCKTNFTEEGFGGVDHATNAPTYENIYHGEALDVYCSCAGSEPTTTPYMSTSTEPGTTTTLFQESDGSDGAFNRTWAEFQSGFSAPNVFWLGNDLMSAMTLSDCSARFELLAAADGQWYVAEYRTFIVGDESQEYRLTVSGYTGNASDAMDTYNGMRFTTYDRDNDFYLVGNCAELYPAAWWYIDCYAYRLITLPMSVERGFGWFGLPPGWDTTYTKAYLICSA